MDENDSNESDELTTIQVYLKSLENKFQDDIVDVESKIESENQEVIDSISIDSKYICAKFKESNTSEPVIIVGSGDDEDQNEYASTTDSNLVLAVGESDSKFYKIPVSNQGNAFITEDGESYKTVAVMSSDINAEQLSYILMLTENNSESSNAENRLLLAEPKISLLDEKATNFLQISNIHSKSPILKEKHDESLECFTCSKCKYSTNKKYLLRRHVKTHSLDRPFECEICHRGFKTVHSMRNHINTHTNTRPYSCILCESTFTTSGELLRHTRYKHTHEKPHKCTECDYASVELSKLKRHMRCHTGERPYCCSHCDYASPDTYKLKRHMRIHTGEKPYVCTICNSAFSQSNTLKAHYIVHSSNKPSYHCVYCPAACARKTDLKNHVQKLHTIGQALKCRKCKRIFNTRYNFKVHRKTCNGEKFFTCEFCPFASVSQQHLETHRFTHTGHVQYQCSLCEEIFDDKKLLELHGVLKHNVNQPSSKVKNIVCPECGKAFRFHGNLVRHSAIHNPEASYSEKEEAVRIGQPKEPGELLDGEEDDFSDDEVYNLEPEDSSSALPYRCITPTVIEKWVMMGGNNVDSDEDIISFDTKPRERQLEIAENGLTREKRNKNKFNTELHISESQPNCDTYNMASKKTKSTIIHVFATHKSADDST